MQKTASDKGKLLSSMLIFGTIGIVRRYIPYPSSVVAMARGFIGVAFLLLVRLIRREPFSTAGLRKNLPLLCLSGAFIGFNWILLFEAYRYTSVSVATVCYYMAPVFVLLASPLVLGERLTLRKSLCAVAAVCGMVLTSGVLETGFSGLRGVALGLGAAVLYASVILLNKRIHGVPAGDRTQIQLAAAAVALLPYVLLTEKAPLPAFDPFAVGMLAVAGVVHTGVAYTLYFDTVERVPAQTAALFSYIDPVTAVLLSVLVLRESLSPLSALGVGLVLGATVVSEFGHPQETKNAPEAGANPFTSEACAGQNPWLEIPLEDYERHMSAADVYQLQTMSRMMRGQFSACPGKSLMILGAAGGNGLEHAAAFEKVYCVDINGEYLAACRARYPALSGALETLCVDLTRLTAPLPHADLLVANLVVEYVGCGCFTAVVRQVRPAFVSCAVMVSGEQAFVSRTPYARVFDRLGEVLHPAEAEDVIAAVTAEGYRLSGRFEEPLPNGKKLLRLDFLEAAAQAPAEM